MYKSRFSNLKNVKAEEWIWIGQEIRRREAQGKESVPCLHRRPLPPDRVVRETARHKNKSTNTENWNKEGPNPSPGRISVRTPPLMTATASELYLNPPDGLVGNHAELSPINIARTPEQLDGCDIAMEFEPEIEASIRKILRYMTGYRANGEMIVRLDPSREWDWGGYSDVDWVTVLSPATATVTKQKPSSYIGRSPRPQFGGQGLSPYDQFVNLEIFDTRPSFQLVANLPWFRLQSILEQPGVISPRFSNLLPDTNRGLRIHLPTGPSYAGRSPIVANKHFY